MLSKEELFDLAVARHAQHMWVTWIAILVGTPTLSAAIEGMGVGFEAGLMIACLWGSLVLWAFLEAHALRKQIECVREQLYQNN